MTKKNQSKKISLKRDSQQWAFDWIVKETGKVFHFQSEGRGRIPRSVRSHDMISKHMGQAAIKLEKLAKEEEAAGHVETAVEIYFQAALQFLDAQHVIFENNDFRINFLFFKPWFEKSPFLTLFIFVLSLYLKR